MSDINKYSYHDLREAAESGKQDDINRLGDWFDRFGDGMYWNGEYHDADGLRIYPVFRPTDEGCDEYEQVGWTDSSDEKDRFLPFVPEQ